MRSIDLIVKKREGQELTNKELAFLVEGYVKGEIPDYQISAFLMASFLKGLSKTETVDLTNIMLKSGHALDLSSINGLKVDKHSTGGVGDKTSLLIAPIVASLGLKVPMMSGRGLGHTGGTLDKLESIKGYSVFLEPLQIKEILDTCGYVMMGQTKDMVPADKLLYALRDVTGTVESIPLITASILSKKKAEGAQALVLDVKTGSGAFMKSLSGSVALSKSLVEVGKGLGLKIKALITDMNTPLGSMIGNFLEVEEVFRILNNDPLVSNVMIEGGVFKASGISGPLIELSLELSSHMVAFDSSKPLGQVRAQVLEVLKNGKAKDCFEKNISAQGGDPRQLEAEIGKRRAPISREIKANQSGFLTRLDAYKLGLACVSLGGGREKSSDTVMPEVGIEILVPYGAKIGADEPVLRVWAQTEAAIEKSLYLIQNSISISNKKAKKYKLFYQEIV